MKKFLIVTSLILALTACGQTNVEAGDLDVSETNVGDGDLDVPKNNENDETNVGDGVLDVPKKDEEPTKIDIDLSGFSTIMAYSEAYNMLSKPDDYLGKIVKVKGFFSMFQDPNTGKYYFATIIADQTSCCQIGMEFVLAGDYEYPKDYPALGTEIEVTGEFQTYMEGNMRYGNLINAKMTY